MTGRTFTLLLIAAAAIGIGAAIGLIAYMERGDAEPDGQPAFAELPQPSASGGQTAAAAPAAPRSDDTVIVSPEGVETLTGTVESVAENTLTLATDQDTETVVVGADTRFALFLERSLEHLEEGANVTLMGQPGDQGEMRATVILLVDPGAGAFGGPGGAFGAGSLRAGGPQPSPEDIAALRAQLGALAGTGEGGQIPPEARQRLRALAAQQAGGPGQGAGFARRGGLSGTIAHVGEGRVTIDTARGPVDAVLHDDTLIRELTSEGQLADLPAGAHVTVLGNRDDDAFRAAQIVMTPDFGQALGGPFSPGGPSPGSSTGP